jgi:hypothetical protein
MSNEQVCTWSRNAAQTTSQKYKQVQEARAAAMYSCQHQRCAGCLGECSLLSAPLAVKLWRMKAWHANTSVTAQLAAHNTDCHHNARAVHDTTAANDTNMHVELGLIHPKP